MDSSNLLSGSETELTPFVFEEERELEDLHGYSVPSLLHPFYFCQHSEDFVAPGEVS